MATPTTLSCASRARRLRRGFGVAATGLLLAGPALAQTLAVTGVVPGRNASAVSRGTNVAVTFNQPVSSGVGQQEVGVFSQQAGGRKAGTITGSGNTLTFDPTTDFKAGEVVSVTVPATIQSSSGQQLTPPQVVQFTTATAPSPGTFSGNQEVVVSRQVEEVVTGDIDGDGDLDLLASNGGNGTISIRLNNGSGTFASPTDLFVGSIVERMALGDVDGDGDLDLLVTTYQRQGIAGFVRVLTNNGQGTFAGSSSVALGTSPFQLVLGDVDADGDLDLVVVNALNFSLRVSVKLNNGSGVFSAAQDLALNANSLALGDIDSDGDLDLLAGITGGSVSVQLNNGQGTYSASQAVAVVGTPNRLVVKDVDSDGDLDVLTSNSNSSIISVSLNNGAGIFSAGTRLTVEGLVNSIALGDIDGDGDQDLLTSNSNLSPNTVSVRLNDGTGTFGGYQPMVAGNATALNLTLGDVDGDNDLDLLVGNSNSTVSVRLNQAQPAPTITSIVPGSNPVSRGVIITGTYFLAPLRVKFNGVLATSFVVNSPTQITVEVPAGATSGPVVVETAAGSSNGFPFTVSLSLLAVAPSRNAVAAPRTTTVAVSLSQPLLTTPGTQQALRVFSQQAGGRKAGVATVSGSTLLFTPAAPFKAGETVFATLTAGAQSLDGTPAAPQVVQFTAATAPSIGSFAAAATWPVGAQPSASAPGDVDGDGDLDLLTANTGTNTVGVRLNNGMGAFSGMQEVPVGQTPVRLALGDIDGDGDLDFVAANFTSSTVSVRFNDGNGVFSGTQNVFASSNTQDVALRDVDADGDLDLLILNTGTIGSVYIRLNDGSGNFSGTQSVTLTAPQDFTVGDLDADGDLDIVVGFNRDVFTNGVNVLLNDGFGNFTLSASTLLVPDAFTGVELGDLDNDGDLDIATSSNQSGGRVRLFSNDGNGTFSNTTPDIAAGPGNLVLGDIDGDGDLDVLTSTLNTEVQVQLNNGNGTFSPATDVTLAGSALVLADVDGNGTLDLVATNYGANVVLVRLNQAFLAPTAAGLRINVGGGDLPTSRGQFTPDQYFSANSSTATTATPIAGTTDDALYQSERYSTGGQLSYAVPVANGAYSVVLHFAETYWTQPGQRVFNIGLEGSTVRTNFDIVAKVGPLTATTETFTVQVTDGVLNLDLVVPYLSGGADQAKLSGLEVLPIAAAYRFNAGGPALPTSRGTFTADQYYSAASGTATSTAAIAGTEDDALYQSERYSTSGQLSYAVPVANGAYSVVLHFAETYWTQPGQRVFNIGLEGSTVRTNFDIVAKVGPNTATTETFTVQVTDGVLNLDLVVPYLSGGADQAKLSGLEIISATGGGRLLAAQAAKPTATAQLSAYPNPTQGRFSLSYSSTQPQTATLSLFDQLGRVAYEQPVRLQAGANEVPVQPGILPAGVYQVVLRTPDGARHTQKLVVQP